jgi:RTA1 like protein
MAAIAYEKNPPADTANGTHIMVAGILFQLASILVFVSLFTIVIMRALKSRGEILTQRKIQWIIAATVFSVVVIVIRSIYRTIELLQGWSGYLITTERYFIALDGAMMVLAVGVFNIARPGWSNTTGDKTDVEGESQVEMTDRSADQK